MALLGDGLLNGSPFYGGFELTDTKVEAPTGLMTFAKLLPSLSTAGATKKETKEKEDETKSNKLYIAGTKGTRNTLKTEFDNVEADIQTTLAQMQGQFDKTKNPTEEQALKSISALGLDTKLRSLIAKKNQLLTTVSEANQDLQQANSIDALYEKDIDAKQEIAVAPTGVKGVYLPIDVDENGKPITYGKAIDKLFEADNTIIDEETGKVSVKSPEYSVYGMGVKQKGALTSKVEGELKNAAPNLTGIDSEKLDEVTGFIKGWSSKDNYDQLLNAATNMKSKLEEAEQADLSAKTIRFNIDNPENTLYSDEEKASITKSYKDKANMTEKDILNIANATDKYLASYVRKELPTYQKKQTGETLEKGLYGSGKYAETVTIPGEVLTFPIDEDGTGNVTYKKSTSYDVTAATSTGALLMTVARDTPAWNPLTGEKVTLPAAGEYFINRYEEVEGKNFKYKPYVVINSGGSNPVLYRIPATQNAMSKLKSAKVKFDKSNLFAEYQENEPKSTTATKPKTTTTTKTATGVKDTRPVVKIEWKDKK